LILEIAILFINGSGSLLRGFFYPDKKSSSFTDKVLETALEIFFSIPQSFYQVFNLLDTAPECRLNRR